MIMKTFVDGSWGRYFDGALTKSPGVSMIGSGRNNRVVCIHFICFFFLRGSAEEYGLQPYAVWKVDLEHVTKAVCAMRNF